MERERLLEINEAQLVAVERRLQASGWKRITRANKSGGAGMNDSQFAIFAGNNKEIHAAAAVV